MRRRTIHVIMALAVLAFGADAQTNAERQLKIGGEAPVVLSRKAKSKKEPQFTAVELLPGRGMNVFQMRAFIPGLGEQELIASPSLTVAAQELSGGADDYAGVKSFKFGGAILVPWANRIRGQLTPDGKFIQTDIAGHELTLPADWSGKKPGAEKHAIHGLMLESKFQDLTQPKRDFEPFCGTLDAGNFDGHWPSRTRVKVCVTLQALTVDLIVTAENAGSDILPMGIGWHPYFAFPGGKREQVKLRVPAKMKTVVNNYDDVFPTGEVVPVADTQYDFNSAPRELGNLYLDDCFLDLTWQKSVGRPAAEIIDPAAHYGLRIIARSAEIKSFQVYAPPDKQFVALEPQFNLADPFNKKIWGDRDTGIVMLKPGESVTYHVTLQLFTPK